MNHPLFCAQHDWDVDLLYVCRITTGLVPHFVPCCTRCNCCAHTLPSTSKVILHTSGGNNTTTHTHSLFHTHTHTYTHIHARAHINVHARTHACRSGTGSFWVSARPLGTSGGAAVHSQVSVTASEAAGTTAFAADTDGMVAVNMTPTKASSHLYG